MLERVARKAGGVRELCDFLDKICRDKVAWSSFVNHFLEFGDASIAGKLVAKGASPSAVSTITMCIQGSARRLRPRLVNFVPSLKTLGRIGEFLQTSAERVNGWYLAFFFPEHLAQRSI